MRLLIALFFPLLSAYPLVAQIAFSAKKITAPQIPKSIKFRGIFEEGWIWNDKLGENILITSVQPPYPDKEPSPVTGDDAFSAELHAFHFVKKDSGYKLLWKISDAGKGCPFDLTVAFIKAAIKITDLDKDSIAETTLQYKLACRSDVSPAQMKLIMHEDTVKYALRGSMWIKTSEESKFAVTEKNVNLETWKEYKNTGDTDEKSVGRYITEKDFISAPKEFLAFARGRWLLYVKESFE